MRLKAWLGGAALWLAAQSETVSRIEQAQLAQLAAVRRVYVDRLSGGETAAQMRDMIISSLQSARLFVITENPERADAVLRGSAEDLVFTETFQWSEGINARASFGTGTPSNSSSGSRRGPSGSAGVGDHESRRTAERKHEATAAVRLVNRDGEVIWSTIEESRGAKFRGASADVAAKITQRLTEDLARARKRPAGQADPKEPGR